MIGHAKHRLSSSTIDIADRPNNDNETYFFQFFFSLHFYKPDLFRYSTVKLVGLARVKEII